MTTLAPVSISVNPSRNGAAIAMPIKANTAPVIVAEDENAWFDRMAAERDYAALVDAALEHRIGGW